MGETKNPANVGETKNPANVGLFEPEAFHYINLPHPHFFTKRWGNKNPTDEGLLLKSFGWGLFKDNYL